MLPKLWYVLTLEPMNQQNHDNLVEGRDNNIG